MNKQQRQRIILTAVIVVLGVLACSTVLDKALDSIPGVRWMNQECVKYLDNWTAKSVTTFVAAKSINAGLSVVEDSEVQVASLDIALGEAVRPLNDLIARVASVALASAASLGIQRILVEIGAWIGLRLFLTLSMVCWLAAIWLGPLTKIDVRRIAGKLLIVALVARFLLPTVVLATGYVGDRFMEGVYAEAQEGLEELKTEAQKADELRAAASASDANIFDRIKNTVGAVGESISLLADNLAGKADIYGEVAINYMVVFIVQTMLMPVLILWGLIKLLGYLFGPAATSGVEARLLAPVRKGEKLGGKPLQTPDVATEAQG